MKTFIIIMLAVILLACDPEDSGSSSEPKKPDPVSRCSITQFQDKTGNKQAIAAMKDLDVGQTRTLFYECTIAPKDYDKKAKIEGFNNTIISLSPVEISLSDQAKATGSFSVKGLKEGQTSIKIDLGTSTKLAITVKAPTIPKASQFTFTQITPNVRFKFVFRNLAVHGDKLYAFEKSKYFVSDDGETWTQKSAIQGLSLIGKSSYLSFKGKLWGWGTNDNIFSSGDGNHPWTKSSKKLPPAALHSQGSSVIFQNQVYLLFGNVSRSIYSSIDGINWNKKYDYQPTGSNPNKITSFDAVVHDDKIWIIGSLITNTNSSAKTVFSYDGSNWKQEADLPQDRYWYGAASFADGLFVIGGAYQDSGLKYRKSLIYSPYGSTWHTIIADTATKIPGNDGIQAVFNMEKWTPKKENIKTKRHCG